MTDKYSLVHEYSFHTGKRITRQELNKWKDRCLEELAKEGIYHFSIRAGRALIVAMKDDETGEITILEITTGYTAYTYI